MTAECGFNTPINKIVVSGNPPITTEYNIKTVANMYPGRLVTTDTTDYGIKVVASSGDPAIGWLGYETTALQFKPANISTIYVVGSQASVISGGGFVIYATLMSGESVTKGDLLKSGTNGTVAKATAGTNDVIGTAENTVDASSSALPIFVKSRI